MHEGGRVPALEDAAVNQFSRRGGGRGRFQAGLTGHQCEVRVIAQHGHRPRDALHVIGLTPQPGYDVTAYRIGPGRPANPALSASSLACLSRVVLPKPAAASTTTTPPRPRDSSSRAGSRALTSKSRSSRASRIAALPGTPQRPRRDSIGRSDYLSIDAWAGPTGNRAPRDEGWM
jgi:hypothetical protein